MIISWHGNAFRVTDLLWGEPTTPRGFPSERASNAIIWNFLSERAVEQTGGLGRHDAHVRLLWCHVPDTDGSNDPRKQRVNNSKENAMVKRDEKQHN